MLGIENFVTCWPTDGFRFLVPNFSLAVSALKQYVGINHLLDMGIAWVPIPFSSLSKHLPVFSEIAVLHDAERKLRVVPNMEIAWWLPTRWKVSVFVTRQA